VCLNFFFMWSGKKFIKNKQKSSTVFEKKKKKKHEKDGKKLLFYKLKKLKKRKAKEKNYFREIRAEKVCYKMDNAKTGCDKVVEPKRRPSQVYQ